jgi:predicted dehydrogenase
MPTTTRRDFLKTASAGTVLAMTAATRARAVGANDRIRIGMIGCGDRGRGAHMTGANRYAKEQNAEFVAVCDPWRVKREEAAAMAKEWCGKEPQQFTSYRDLLEKGEVDAVMIASPDHVHTLHLEAAANAKKDVYCEKPLAKSLDTLKAACDAVKANNVVAQIGTQLRSMPSMTGAKALYQTGLLGKVGRIEQHRNGDRPYWYAYVKDVKEEDVDWKEFLSGLPDRPFDPVLFTGWYGYREFSDGPLPGLGSHYIDLVHYITGATFPTSAVALGGTFTWKDENNFTAPDQVTAQWIYPEGFLVEYTTNFGNGSGSTFKILGDQGVMDLQDWSNPFVTADGVRKPDGRIKEKTKVEHVEHADHVLDWLQCIRSRQTPNASIDAGYQHAVACLMGVQAMETGKRMTYDAEKREIREG